MRRALIIAAVAGLVVPSARADHPLDLMPPVDGPIVRHFEPPPTPFAAGHRGIDFRAESGSVVVAAGGGVVAFAGQVGGDLFVSIDHPGGTRATYSYLSQVLVTAGQTVEQGHPIALSGPGHAGEEPAHLHFGLRLGSDYLDPEPVLLESLRRNLWRVVRLAPTG